MVLDIELIQFYRSDTLDELMKRSAKLCRSIGFPLLSLSWTPAPGPDHKMLKNETLVWENFGQHLGQKGLLLKAELARSLDEALKQNDTDTKACQNWVVQQKRVFQMFADAPTDFLLSRQRRDLLQAISNRSWSEFFAMPVCRERDRSLVLMAKTPETVTPERKTAITRLLETAVNAYRFLYIKDPITQPAAQRTNSDRALSRREVECLQWLAAGKTLFEAAIILGISERTLRYHINNARERLGVATTVQAIVAAALTYGFDPRDARQSICASSRP